MALEEEAFQVEFILHQLTLREFIEAKPLTSNSFLIVFFIVR